MHQKKKIAAVIDTQRGLSKHGGYKGKNTNRYSFIVMYSVLPLKDIILQGDVDYEVGSDIDPTNAIWPS